MWLIFHRLQRILSFLQDLKYVRFCSVITESTVRTIKKQNMLIRAANFVINQQGNKNLIQIQLKPMERLIEFNGFLISLYVIQL